jgi:hypothetical protein
VLLAMLLLLLLLRLPWHLVSNLQMHVCLRLG